MRNKKAEFDKAKDSITPEESYAGTRQLQTLGEEIQSKTAFPTYLASWVKFVFTGYIVTAFFSFGWLTNPVQNPQAELLLLFLFCSSTFGFFVVVWNAIKDIYELMKEEFEQLKKEQQEMEKTRKELEEFKKKIRAAKSEK